MISTVEHRGVVGALVYDANRDLVFVQIRRNGIDIVSTPARLDLSESDSVVRANWADAVERYLASNV